LSMASPAPLHPLQSLLIFGILAAAAT
jgi:hypothetical protein